MASLAQGDSQGSTLMAGESGDLEAGLGGSKAPPPASSAKARWLGSLCKCRKGERLAGGCSLCPRHVSLGPNPRVRCVCSCSYLPHCPCVHLMYSGLTALTAGVAG